jgi:hypothetical protein
MSYPYSQVQKVLADAAATAAGAIDASLASAAGSLQLRIITTGFSGTIDIQGKLDANEAAWGNLFYVTMADGALTPSNDQLSYTTNTGVVDIVVLNPMPQMRLNMTRTAGSVTVYARAYEHPLTLALVSA